MLEDDAGPDGRPGRRRKLGDIITWGWEKGESLPIGMENLGNTCYMAAALQVLRAVPELVRGVMTSSGAGDGVEADLQVMSRVKRERRGGGGGGGTGRPAGDEQRID